MNDWKTVNTEVEFVNNKKLEFGNITEVIPMHNTHVLYSVKPFNPSFPVMDLEYYEIRRSTRKIFKELFKI